MNFKDVLIQGEINISCSFLECSYTANLKKKKCAAGHLCTYCFFICIIFLAGEISDCSAVRVPQGQFTPLADALCWVIHRLTKDGGCAEADAVQALLTTTFPNLNAPDPAHVHTTLSNLIQHCKVYYSGHSYGIVQPHTYQVTAVPSTLPSSSFTLSCTASSTSQQLMDAGTDCSGADVVCEDGISHAAVQTDLAELITGASQPSDILITPKPPGQQFKTPTVLHIILYLIVLRFGYHISTIFLCMFDILQVKLFTVILHIGVILTKVKQLPVIIHVGLVISQLPVILHVGFLTHLTQFSHTNKAVANISTGRFCYHLCKAVASNSKCWFGYQLGKEVAIHFIHLDISLRGASMKN